VKEKESSWYKIAEHINEIPFSENNIGIAEVKGKKVCIAKYGDNIYAFAHTCPHAGGNLADGYIDALGNIVCPMHRYKYDLKNGRNVSGEGYYLKSWPIEMRTDGVFIKMAVGGLWNLF